MTDLKSKVITVEIDEELKKSYMNYSMSVIVSRALPDVRDGLKPSQRRILYSMHELNLNPGGQFRKCAKIAGDTSGNYHPHGEAVVYPTLVRMAQPWALRYMLVDGQGNFGSIDGDPPAAMRYTEARLQRAAIDLMDDLEKETVDFRGNYDDTRKEPTVFPSKFPNMLVNGASGIAVGMATSMPPHNINEVCSAIIALIDNPELTSLDLLQYIKGPDFPTGGTILGTKGITEYFATGRGKVIVRGKAEIEKKSNDQELIVIKEIPYQVNKTLLIERIVELVKTKRIEGIADIRDESGRQGMRLVIVIKKTADAQTVLNKLYKYSQLQGTFGVINLALVNGAPEVLPMKDLVQNFIDFRHEVVVRRTQFLLKNAEARLHILEGYRIALDNIDEVIATIRASETTQIASEQLQLKFGLSEIQAKAILEMRLQRLTGLERDKIEQEYNEIVKTVHELKEILEKKELRMNIIKDETQQISDKYNDNRKTEIGKSEGTEISDLDLIPDETCVITLSHEGYIKRMPINLYRTQARGGKGSSGTNLKEDDFVQYIFVASTHDYILFFTNLGKCLWLRVHEIPEAGKQARGKAIINLLEIEQGEKIKTLVTCDNLRDDHYIVMATKKGLIKKTALSAYSRPRSKGIIAINLNDGDELIDARISDGQSFIAMATADGFCNRFAETDIRATGRNTAGVTGIRLRPTDEVMSMLVLSSEGNLLTLTEKGYGKRTAISEYTQTKRGSKGVSAFASDKTSKIGKLVTMMEVADSDELMIITKNGIIIRQKVENINLQGRRTQGVKLINVGEDDMVHDVTKISEEDQEENLALQEKLVLERQQYAKEMQEAYPNDDEENLLNPLEEDDEENDIPNEDEEDE
ncbi:MAG TPA: DNA gyrase subunit A [Candidatus Cloacimonadota bacterium]|nr:DNA gyrase subunit A [Candidatus Cloacimonadota bacterium]HPK40373.1 DNA gyrase subunit A [Candidatus Cloacimonadota bacterium]